ARTDSGHLALGHHDHHGPPGRPRPRDGRAVRVPSGYPDHRRGRRPQGAAPREGRDRAGRGRTAGRGARHGLRRRLVRSMVPGQLSEDTLAAAVRGLPAATGARDLPGRPARLTRGVPLARPDRGQAHIRSNRRQALVESWYITSSTGRRLSFATSSATRLASQGPESTPSNSPPYSHGPSPSTSSASRGTPRTSS